MKITLIRRIFGVFFLIEVIDDIDVIEVIDVIETIDVVAVSLLKNSACVAPCGFPPRRAGQGRSRGP